MDIPLVILILCFLGWGGASLLLRQSYSLNRLFLFLLMSIWLYVSIALFIISLEPPLWVWLLIGFAPIAVIAYGYRYYDAKQNTETIENDDSSKHIS